jgi:hypothetical protein
MNTNCSLDDVIIERNPINDHYLSSFPSSSFLIKKKVDECLRPEVNATN